MAERFKINDQVVVLAGNSKGISGKILKIIGADSNTKRVVIENTLSGLKSFKKSSNQSGKQESFIRSIHISNISHCEDGKISKVGFKYNESGDKILYFKNSGNMVRLIRKNKEVKVDEC
jgi:large subunit ribosomal protein L24